MCQIFLVPKKKPYSQLNEKCQETFSNKYSNRVMSN